MLGLGGVYCLVWFLHWWLRYLITEELKHVRRAGCLLGEEACIQWQPIKEDSFNHYILQISAFFKWCPTLNQILDLAYLRISLLGQLSSVKIVCLDPCRQTQCSLLELHCH